MIPSAIPIIASVTISSVKLNPECLFLIINPIYASIYQFLGNVNSINCGMRITESGINSLIMLYFLSFSLYFLWLCLVLFCNPQFLIYNRSIPVTLSNCAKATRKLYCACAKLVFARVNATLVSNTSRLVPTPLRYRDSDNR